MLWTLAIVPALASCGSGGVTFRTARTLVLPGTGKTETVYDTRHLLGGGPNRRANELAIQGALRGDWKLAYATWFPSKDCAGRNNAAVAAAMLGKRAHAIAQISEAAHKCPGVEAIRENARVIFSDGVPILPPRVELSAGATEQPRATTIPRGGGK